MQSRDSVGRTTVSTYRARQLWWPAGLGRRAVGGRWIPIRRRSPAGSGRNAMVSVWLSVDGDKEGLGRPRRAAYTYLIPNELTLVMNYRRPTHIYT